MLWFAPHITTRAAVDNQVENKSRLWSDSNTTQDVTGSVYAIRTFLTLICLQRDDCSGIGPLLMQQCTQQVRAAVVGGVLTTGFLIASVSKNYYSSGMKPMITKEEARQRIAGHVNLLLERKGITGTELARRSGVAQPRIVLLRRAELLPNPADLWNIAEALGTTANGLLKELPELAIH